MTGLKKTLFQFWSQFGIPAYLSDCVPDDAVLPYITYSVSRSDLNGQTIQSAFVWCPRSEPYGNVWRTKMMDDIELAIPTGGLLLTVDKGYVIIYRNVDFLKDWQDPEDADVLGVRVSYIIQHYNL